MLKIASLSVIFVAILIAVSLVVYSAFAFIGGVNDVMEWHPLGRFLLIVVSLMVGIPSAILGSSYVYMEMLEKKNA